MYVIFLRRGSDNDKLIAKYELTQDKLLAGIEKHITMLASMDSRQAYPLNVGATTLLRLQWYQAAEKVFRSALDRDDEYHEAWTSLGRVLARQGLSNIAVGKPGIKQLEEARKCFMRALVISPNNPEANYNYDRVENDLEYLR